MNKVLITSLSGLLFLVILISALPQTNPINSCTDCDTEKHIAKQACNLDYKEDKNQCRAEYRQCKKQHNKKLKTCKKEFRTCKRNAESEKKLCLRIVKENYRECKQNCNREEIFCLNHNDCSEGQFCMFSNCESNTGICQEVPSVCSFDYHPVCGCDGLTYSNTCSLFASKVTLDYNAPCIS